MLKSIRILVMTLTLVMGMGSFAMAEDFGSLSGQQWIASSHAEKLAFLYGASSLVAIEHTIEMKSGNKASVFVEKWLQAFGNDDLNDLCAKVDKWYASHPEDASRHVFDVLWYEFMAPETKK